MALRILVVDDNEAFRALASRLLASDGFEVVESVTTSAEALDAVARTCPDVALVDVNLGAERGVDLARRLQSTSRGRGPAVIMMSTQAEDDLADLLAHSPAAGFVPKHRLSGDAVRAALAGHG